MKKTFLVLAVFLTLAVLVSGCTGDKSTADVQDTQSSTPGVPAGDVVGTDEIPEVSEAGGIEIEEPVQDAETEVDLGSLI
ncbi:MAG: hypothetical protein KAJ56_00510 [Candidatus Aenigmarchaeota archaeon]|nr:hypothetical protein [Candidatus Aenigmarchaeota archaeon]MCK5289399.1 hypothetical protein [Candidatus Aenigmarchaeota archaeon]